MMRNADNTAFRALGANLPIDENQWKNVDSTQKILNAFYSSGNFYPGIHIKELMKATGLPKHSIYYRFTQWHNEDRKAGKSVPNPPKATRFSDKQRQILHQGYQKNAYPSTQKTVRLSILTRLTTNQVKHWFETERRRDRRRDQEQQLQNQAEALPPNMLPTCTKLLTEDQIKKEDVWVLEEGDAKDWPPQKGDYLQGTSYEPSPPPTPKSNRQHNA